MDYKIYRSNEPHFVPGPHKAMFMEPLKSGPVWTWYKVGFVASAIFIIHHLSGLIHTLFP